jgi:hypothetical protein
MENIPLKQQRGHQTRQKKEKKKWDNRENSAREISAEFGGANNAPVSISMTSTVRSCWVLDICFFSHSNTNWLEGFEIIKSVWQKSHNPFDRNHHRKRSGK